MKILFQAFILIFLHSIISGQNPNQSLRFDGVDDYVSIANPPIFTSGSWTIEFWAKKDLGSYSLPIAIGNTLDTNQYLHIGWTTPTTFVCGFYNNDLSVLMSDNGQWHHYAVVYNANAQAQEHNRFIYRNGVLLTSDESPTFIGDPDIELGRAGLLSNPNFTGSLERLAFYEIAKTPEDLLESYQCELSSDGMVQLYSFNQHQYNNTVLEQYYNVFPNNNGVLHNFNFSDVTSGWTEDTPYEIGHFSIPMLDQELFPGDDLVLNSNFLPGDCDDVDYTFGWFREGVYLNETSPSLTLQNLSFSDAGEYSIQLYPSVGSGFSSSVNVSTYQFSVTQDISDYYIDVEWDLPSLPCLVDPSGDAYDDVTIQLMRDQTQIDFQSFTTAQIDSIITNNGSIMGSYRDFVGPDAGFQYSINVFVGLYGTPHVDCFDLQKYGSTSSIQEPISTFIEGFDRVTFEINSTSDLATSFEIYRGNQLLKTYLNIDSDTIFTFEDIYKFDQASSINSGVQYDYDLKMISSNTSQINTYDLGNRSTIDMYHAALGAPSNVSRVDLAWADLSEYYDKIQLWREGKLLAVKQNTDQGHVDFSPHFGDTVSYQLRFIENDTIRADFSMEAYLEGNGALSGRVVTQEGLFPVDGVTVTATRKYKSQEFTAVTNSSGQFSFTDLPYGLLDSFSLEAVKGAHTFAYPTKSFGVSSMENVIDNALILDDFIYTEGNATHTINSFDVNPILDQDKTTISWDLTTSASSVFIDLIRNGDIIFSSTSMADLTKTFDDLTGTPNEESIYQIRIYTIVGTTVSSKQQTIEVNFPPVAAIPNSSFSASEEQFEGVGTGNVLLSFSHTSTNFDKYRIYRNNEHLVELDKNALFYIDNTAPFDSNLVYSIVAIRTLNNTTYKTEIATTASPSPFNLGLMPAPFNISVHQQTYDPSILINWNPPSISQIFDYTGYLIYRNGELIATKYKDIGGYYVFDRRGFGMQDITYSVSLFKQTATGIIESERGLSAQIDFPLINSFPGVVTSVNPNNNGVELLFNNDGVGGTILSSNFSGFIIEQLSQSLDGSIIARLPPDAQSFHHYPKNDDALPYKIYTYNTHNGIDYVSSESVSVSVPFTPDAGPVYKPQNFTASKNLGNHVKLCWEYLDFVPSEFIIYREGIAIDTLPIGTRSYYDYTASNDNSVEGKLYTIRALQQDNLSGSVGDFGLISKKRLIYGTLTDPITMEGIANAAIEIEYPNRKVLEAYTDSSGYYSFISATDWEGVSLPINASIFNTQVDEVVNASTSPAVRVDFTFNIPDRPVVTGLGTIEYADVDVNIYTLHSTIHWRVNNDNYDGVEVYRGLDLIGTIPKEESNILMDSTAIPGIEYPYYIRTYKATDIGVEFSPMYGRIITYPPIDPVINLTATPQLSTNQILVQWSHLYEHADGYIVSINGSPTVNISADSLFMYYDADGIAGEEYTYTLTAYKIIDGIPYASVEKMVTAIFPAAAPVVDIEVSKPLSNLIPLDDVTPGFHGLNHVLVEWDHEGSNVESYKVFRDNALIATVDPDSTHNYADYEGIPEGPGGATTEYTYSVSTLIIQQGARKESVKKSKEIVYPQLAGVPDELFTATVDEDEGAIGLKWKYFSRGIDNFLITATNNLGVTRTLTYSDDLILDGSEFHELLDDGGAPGEVITYTIKAYSERDGVTYNSIIVSSDPVTYPFPPIPDLMASDGTYDRAIELTWTSSPDAAVDSFKISRTNQSTSNTIDIGIFGSDARKYLDVDNLDESASTTYLYSVKPCRVINGVTTCYLESEDTDLGTINDNSLINSVSEFGRLGESIDVHGNWMIARHSGQNAVNFYELVNNNWTFKQEIIDPQGGGNGFGTSVAIWGDLAVVGTPGYTTFASDQGALYIYKRNATGTWELDRLETTGEPGNEMGHSVDIEDGVIVAGVQTDDGTVADKLELSFVVLKRPSSCGALCGNQAYESLSIGSPSGQITSWNMVSGENFRSIAIDGDNIFVGNGSSSPPPSFTTPFGFVAHYKVTTTGISFQSAFDNGGVLYFGSNLDAEGNRIVVTGSNTSDVQIYQEDGSSWDFLINIQTSVPNSAATFGHSIRYVDDLLLITEAGEALSEGQKVYLYKEDGDDYTLIHSPNPGESNYRPEFHNADAETPPYSNGFAYAIALTPDRVIVTDPNNVTPYSGNPIDETIYSFDIYDPKVDTVAATNGTSTFTRIEWESECVDCPTGYIDHFNIYRDSELIKEVGGAETQFFDDPDQVLTSASHANPGQVYTYEVSAAYGETGQESAKTADQGYSKRIGKISGNVYVIGTTTGVPDVNILVTGVDTLNNQPYSYTTVSQADGSFLIDEMYVTSTPIKYKITPSLLDTELEINGSDTQLLSIAAPEKSNIIIFDKTSFVINGFVENDISGCGLEGLTVSYFETINGLESLVDTVSTDKEGFYSLLVQPNTPNLQKIKIKVDDLNIIDDNSTGESDTIQYQFFTQQVEYTDFNNFPDVIRLDFIESLSYPITLRVLNACTNPIADQPVKIRASSLDGCVEFTVNTNASGEVTIDLPPKNYIFAVESLVGSGITNYENTAIDYLMLRQFNLDLKTIHVEAGGAEVLPAVDPILFEFHKAPVFALSTSFDRYLCDDPTEPAIITQGDDHTINVSISENHKPGETCNVFGGYIRILNPASLNSSDTLYSNGGNFPPYTFTASGPNLVSPYTYGISMQYFSDDGNYLGQRIISVINEGQRQLPGTGIITESEADDAGNLLFPLLVLRDPPGDGSYSSIESGTTISKSLEIADESSGSFGFYLESEFTLGAGFFANLMVGGGGGNASSKTFDISLTTSQTYSTSDSEDAVGRGADVIVGSGLSQQYGLARSLFFEDDCTPSNETSLTFGTGGFVSTYAYTVDFIEGLIEGYIRDSIDVEIGARNYTKPDGSVYTKAAARQRIHALITAWKEMLHYHDVETVPHYVLCSDFSYRDGISEDAQAVYDGWRNGFCTQIGSYEGDKFIMDDEIEWTPSLINVYNNAIAFTDKLKDPLSFIDDGDLSVSNNDIESNSLSVTNEYHNLLGNQLKSAEVFDISGNVNFDRTVTAQQSSSTSKSFTRFFYFDFAGGFASAAESLVGFGVLTKLTAYDLKAGVSITADASINVSKSQAEDNESTISYHIFDDDPEDQVTFIALQAPLQDQTPYFIRLGGLSSCPAEEALTLSQDEAPLEIDDFIMNVVIDPESGAVSDTPPPRYNADPEEAAIFEVKISSEGPTGLVRDAQIFLDLATNPFGAIIKIGGSDLNIVSPIFSIPAGGTLTQFLSFERPPGTPFYHFEGVRIGIRPACGGEAKYINLDVFFDSPCSDVSLTMPINHYVVNRINPNIDDDTEIIPFEIKDYDSGTNSNLNDIRLQYRRLGNNSGWLPVSGAVFSKAFLADSDQMLAAGQDPLYFYEWDITGKYNQLPDGDYLVRAKASCGVSGINYSNEVMVEIRRSPLLVTGYPQPADGIWTEGDEISSTFSTDIDCDLLNVIGDDISDYLSLIDLSTMMEVPFDYVCQDNKMTLIPLEDMSTYDGTTIRAIYSGILNLQENVAETVIWDFKVVTQSVDWVEDVIEITMYQDEIKTISTSLFNSTMSPIDGLSINGGSGLEWLTVDPSNAISVPPVIGESIDLIFDGDVPAGDYSTTLIVDGLNGDRDPELLVMVHIIERPPFPAINNNFTDSMQLVLNWSYTDPYELSHDTQDAIFIYKDGQLRGGGYILAEGNFFYTKVTVYGNIEDEGELLDFVVYNANEQKAYSSISAIMIPFEANTSRGLIPNPEVILIDNELFELAGKIYVDHTNTGTQDGLTWATAFSDLQDGISAARAGAEIWVAEGTYYPTAGGSREISFEVIEAIMMYGGFVNGMEEISDRTGTNETILSGDLLIPNVNTDNTYHVIQSTSTDLWLDGLTIMNGNANTAPDDKGGCLHNTGKVTLKNCNMSNGNALQEGTLIYNSGQMTIDGGTFTIPAVPTVSNVYNDSGGLITIQQNVSIIKE